PAFRLPARHPQGTQPTKRPRWLDGRLHGVEDARAFVPDVPIAGDPLRSCSTHRPGLVAMASHPAQPGGGHLDVRDGPDTTLPEVVVAIPLKPAPWDAEEEFAGLLAHVSLAFGLQRNYGQPGRKPFHERQAKPLVAQGRQD